MAKNGVLSSGQRRFVAALMATRTVRDACEAAKVAERTGTRWLTRPEVRAELAQRQDAALSQVARRMASSMTLALTVLEAVMVDKNHSASVRVSAARAVLENGLRFAEIVSLADRVSRLEASGEIDGTGKAPRT